MNIKLLDCTLRDGGYINDWKFSSSVIRYMLHRYVNTGVEFVEVGFLDERRPFDKDRTIAPTTRALDNVIGSIEKKETKFFAMIDYGTCSIENLENKKDSIIDGIRIIFKKPNMYRAIDFAEKVKSKGYLVTLQLVSVTSYSDKDIIEFCKEANKLEPYAVGVVDTYGLMHREQMQHYFELLDFNLKKEISIGYHSHNNFQLAYSNTIEMTSLSHTRNIILDGSAHGIGKSAGNAPIELLAMYLNDNFNKNYQMNEILEIIDTCIIPIKNRCAWGYSLNYFLAASNDCHPNYISYLLDKATLSVGSINEIVKHLEGDKKLNYDEDLIGQLYLEYQSVKCDDINALEKVKKEFKDKNILLLAPGKSMMEQSDVIDSYIINNDLKIISVNFVPKVIDVDAVFVGNGKRYKHIIERLEKKNMVNKVIATSNVSLVKDELNCIINTDRLFDSRKEIADNSTAMILNLLSIIKPKSVAMAGFDGYRIDLLRDYYCDESFMFSDNSKRLELVNEQLSEKIKDMKAELNISFVTDSIYEE